MAYVNVSEWTPEHVAEWLRGLEGCLLPYVHFFLNNNIDGNSLLNLSPDDLNNLHIFKIGHQELILEAVDLLRQLHYGLTLETLQFLALKLGCKARSLHNNLRLNGPQEFENVKQERVSTETLSAVSDILISVKSLVSWLDRYPFEYQDQYIRVKKNVLKLSIEIASTAQRDQFAEKPHLLIKNSSLQLADICDKVVQEFNDSLIIQPASLDIATIKKKPEEEVGMHIQSTYSGVHIISSMKPQSPATRCAKVEEGDEIVQVNYQTVTGWHLKSFLEAMKEHPTEIHLTLKKRPRHTNILGQIIILRPYRIPSKKTAFGKVHKWSEGNSSLHIQEVYSVSNDSDIQRNNTDDDDDSAFLPDDAVNGKHSNISEANFQYRMFPTASHATLQRRATVSGASPTVLKAPINIEDLINGVPLIAHKENIIRSVSHDPSKLNTSIEKSILVTDSIILKSEDSVEQVCSTTESKSNFERKSEQEVCTHDPENDLRTKSIDITQLKHEKSSLQTSDILNVQEEEYIILENKSIKTMNDNAVSQKKQPISNSLIKDESEINQSCDHSIKESTLVHYQQPALGHKPSVPSKAVSILSNWEGADTSFGGRRPSSHEISNVIASSTSDSNPVYLRKVSKLENFENGKSLDKETKLKEHNSYQVVVVGGVAQKCPTTSKEGKKDNDQIVSQCRRTAGIVGKFGHRRISCKDLGMGDCQGWLYKQKDKKDFFPMTSQWSKRWIILKNHYLYAYRDRNDSKAECLIFLPGSTVSPVVGCKTKKYCFKVSHFNTSFYFATETQCDLSKWMNKMGLAAIAYDASSDITTSGFLKPEVILGVENAFYSETDDSDDSNSRDYNYKQSFLEPNKMQYSTSPIHHEHWKNTTKMQPLHDLRSKFLKSESDSHCSNFKNSHHYELKYSKSQSHVLSNSDSYKNSYQLLSKESELSLLNRKPNISYKRSFSYTDAAHTPLKSEIIPRLAYKATYEDALLSKNLQQEPSQAIVNNEYDILTLSLGRQKSIAKEITPGLVARMAVSYSNLSNKNLRSSSSSDKTTVFKGIPSPGYVAKISDTFDHLARNSTDIPKSYQIAKSRSSCQQITGNMYNNYSHNSCKRSASESHVAHNTPSSSYNNSVTSTDIFPQSNANKDVENKTTIPGTLVSRLDRDHYRLYGRKKISQFSMKSSVSLDHGSAGSSKRTMRFFPDEEDSAEFKQSHIVHNVSLKNNFPITTSNNCYSPLQSNVSTSASSFKKSTSQFQTNKSEKSNDLKSHIQSVFSNKQTKKELEFCKGIENIGYVSPEQKKHSCSVSKNISNEGFTTMLNESVEQCNRQSSYCADSLVFHTRCEIESNLPPKCATLDSPITKFNSPLKFFGSPKFMKKLSSPKLDKKNIFKSKKQAKEMKKEMKDASNTPCERKLFGSPRLARAIFGSPKISKKRNPMQNANYTQNTVSSGVQTDLVCTEVSKTDFYLQEQTSETLDNQSTENSSEMSSINFSSASLETDHYVPESSKTSSNSSLNSDASSIILSAANLHYNSKKRPQVTISLPLTTDKVEERATTPETPRTPLKPTMGISMLGKRRLPSISGESSISLSSSKSLRDEIQSELNCDSEVKINSDIDDVGRDEMAHFLEALHEADLSPDGTDLKARRCRTMLMHFSNKPICQLILELRALQRTLTDKKTELDAIDELCENAVIDHNVLSKWIAAHPDLYMSCSN